PRSAEPLFRKFRVVIEDRILDRDQLRHANLPALIVGFSPVLCERWSAVYISLLTGGVNCVTPPAIYFIRRGRPIGRPLFAGAIRKIRPRRKDHTAAAADPLSGGAARRYSGT